MDITTGDFGGYRLSLQSVTGEAHSALTRATEAERQAIRAILNDAIERLIGGDLLECTDTPSDERKRLLVLDREPLQAPFFQNVDEAPPDPIV